MFIQVFLLLCCVNAEVVSLNHQNFYNIVGRGENVFIKFFAPWCGHCKRLAPEYVKLSEEVSGNKNLIIAELDCDNENNREICGKYGISGYPTLKYIKKGTTEAVDYKGGRTVAEMKAFIEEQGKPQIPTQVVALTEKTFDNIVNDKKKNVFVKFFAPWCGHCKALAPKYIEISKMYAGEEDLVVAEVDCTENRAVCDKFGVSGYPTLKSFPKDNKKGVDYQGGREIKDFVEYFNSNYGYQRGEDGKIFKTAGRIEELDEIAKEFIKSEDKQKLLAKAEKIEGGKYYVKTMKRIIEKGNDYVQKEIKRISKMIEDGGLKAKKVDDFQRNLNILSAFTEDD